jgi:hypothetical protein
VILFLAGVIARSLQVYPFVSCGLPQSLAGWANVGELLRLVL